MKLPEGPKYLWDVETDGLLQELTVIHILAIRDLDTGQTHVFRKNKRIDNIRRGIEMLNGAELWVGHNLLNFDCPAIDKVYPGELDQTAPLIRDTMVLSRVFYADVKEADFRRWKQGTLDGKEIGRHGLEAWGQRLGERKGDYSKMMTERAKAAGITDKDEIRKYVWGTWCQEMEDYCVQDLNVNEQLWKMMDAERRHSEQSITLEHRVHNLMEQVTTNGFPLDIPAAKALEKQLRAVFDAKTKVAIAHFGKWWVASKWKRVGKEYKVEALDATGTPIIDDDGKVVKSNKPFQPRPEYGEDNSRQTWAEVVNPKRSIRYKPELMVKKGGDKEAGCPYCPIELREFNPNSRDQIIDRLQVIYEWEPQEFTETGRPAVNDEVLRDLAHTIPICEELAELFYYNKRLGQLVDGKNGWIGKAMERGDGRIHPKFNVGGTVTNRASHSDPNIAQVPRVVFKKLKQWVEPGVAARHGQGAKLVYGIPILDKDGVEVGFNEALTPLCGPDGKQIIGTPATPKKIEDAYDEDGVLKPGYALLQGREMPVKLDDAGAVVTKKMLMKGREGDHGWDSRNLFIVPEGWVLMGADQKGIELRALGHFMSEFDGGVYGRLCVDSDPHDLHTQVLELDSRDTAKTFVYALIYGAQPFKLGTVIDPTLANKPQEAKRIGQEMQRRLMTRIPALGLLVRKVQKEARSGMLKALDGRTLFVRAQHAALNTLLQGCGATIAKQWCINFAQYCEEDGLLHGWDGDFAILAWIHDELQVAVRDDPRIIAICEKNIVDAAYDAGKMLGFQLPVDIDVKFGRRWSDTH